MNDPFNWLVVVFIVCGILAAIAVGWVAVWLVIFAWALFSSA